MQKEIRLLPMKQMWISITLIFFPILIMIALKLFGLFESILDAKKIGNVVASLSLLGMLLLFLTKWNKDDGDEMYLQIRLHASFAGLIFAPCILLIYSIFNLFDWLYIDFAYNGFSITFMILFMQLFTFAYKIYEMKKEEEQQRSNEK